VERRDNRYQSPDELSPAEQAQLAEGEAVICAGIDNARNALEALLSVKERLGKERSAAWLDREFPGRWLAMLDDLALLLPVEADHQRLLDAYPAAIEGPTSGPLDVSTTG
jgi:hypothetical protein